VIVSFAFTSVNAIDSAQALSSQLKVLKKFCNVNSEEGNFKRSADSIRRLFIRKSAAGKFDIRAAGGLLPAAW
jgi:hypothetical protein